MKMLKKIICFRIIKIEDLFEDFHECFRGTLFSRRCSGGLLWVDSIVERLKNRIYFWIIEINMRCFRGLLKL